ncbi:AAA family ATPase [Desulfobulbus sp.]|uniref:AAA family ATPase n=1 Tax=Desulfobulbus sp. TaxID=895 RepID=UPI0027BA9564|nr:AAA family ATPase [Desulfobulbus sp.]
MKAAAISQALELLVDIRQPVFLWGPPGVGKSQIVRQTADRAGLQLIDIRAVLLDPVDLRGLPRIAEDGTAVWCAPGIFSPGGPGHSLPGRTQRGPALGAGLLLSAGARPQAR